MLLDPKIKIIEVSLQGVLHAVVPVISNNRVIAYKNAPEKRLNRALRQMEREYGLNLTFTPDNPGDRVTDLVSIDLKPVKTKKSLNVGCPGYPEHHRCKCHTEIDTSLGDDLPKCTARDRTKEIYLNYLRNEPEEPQNGNADLWLDIVKEENKDPDSIDEWYNCECPFCSGFVSESGEWLSKNMKYPIDTFKNCLEENSPVICKSCQISFKWDFDKNIVVMRNERTE